MSSAAILSDGMPVQKNNSLSVHPHIIACLGCLAWTTVTLTVFYCQNDSYLNFLFRSVLFKLSQILSCCAAKFPRRDGLHLRTCAIIIKHLWCDKEMERGGIWTAGQKRRCLQREHRQRACMSKHTVLTPNSDGCLVRITLCRIWRHFGVFFP